MDYLNEMIEIPRWGLWLGCWISFTSGLLFMVFARKARGNRRG